MHDYDLPALSLSDYFSPLTRKTCVFALEWLLRSCSNGHFSHIFSYMFTSKNGCSYKVVISPTKVFSVPRSNPKLTVCHSRRLSKSNHGYVSFGADVVTFIIAIFAHLSLLLNKKKKDLQNGSCGLRPSFLLVCLLSRVFLSFFSSPFLESIKLPPSPLEHA